MALENNEIATWILANSVSEKAKNILIMTKYRIFNSIQIHAHFYKYSNNNY